MRSTPPKKRSPRKPRQNERRLGMLAVCFVLLALFVILGPKQPVQKALNVNAQGEMVLSHQGLVISEVMSDNASALPDEKGNFPDWLEVWNSTSEPMQLEGITLSNRSDKAKFVFPKMTLEADGRVVVFCDDTNQNDAGKPFHAKFKLSSIQVSAFLFDTGGYILSQVDVPTLNANETYYLDENFSYVKGEDIFSPGFPNTAEGHEAYMGSYRIEAGTLLLNEIMAAPRSGLRDEDGELSDWIELKSFSTELIDLSHYALSDNEGRPIKWPFPAGSYIAPGGTFLVFCSGKDRANIGGYPHTNFSISAEGETITLSTLQGQLVDRIVFDNLPADTSYGRNAETGSWQLFTTATPGADNNAAGAAMADEYLRAINPTKVYISEVMSSNNSVSLGSGQPLSDWVELVNQSDQVVDMSLWGLSDNISWPRKWQFPVGTSIWPGEHKVVFLDKSTQAGVDASSLHASFALDRLGGETVTLSDPTGRVLDKLTLPAIPVDISYGRSFGREGFFYFDGATPGVQNGTGFPGFSSPPVFSAQGGLYRQNVEIALSVSDRSTIRYTLDGSIPTLENSLEYTGPITIADTTVLRARSFAGGLQPSGTITNTYVLKTYYTLPVVCLTTDPDELWNQETGMYAAGEGVDLTTFKYIPFKNPTPTYRTYGKVFRPGFAEMFDSATQNVTFSQGVEFGLIGQYSLDMPQKSFKVKAKASMGNRYFNAKLFEDRPFEQYKSIVLRVSGNDAVWTRMIDGVQSRLIDQVPDTTVIHQAWRPVIVYLNGQYWGHYNMRERVSRYFVAQHEGIPLEKADDMTILEASWKEYFGSNAEYRAMIEKIKAGNPASNPEDLQYILDNVDVDNLFDFLIYQMLFNNTDSGNIRFYRVPEGKWRWIIFDMDYGLFRAANNGVRNMMNPKGHGANDDIDNTIWVKLLENDQMLDKFLRRFGELFRFFTVEKMLAQVDECYQTMLPEMNMHFERWAAFNLKNISSDQPQTVDGSFRYWNSRIDRLYNVIRKRPRHAWVQVKEWFNLSDAQMLEYFGPKPEFPATAILDKDDQI